MGRGKSRKIYTPRVTSLILN